MHRHVEAVDFITRHIGQNHRYGLCLRIIIPVLDIGRYLLKVRLFIHPFGSLLQFCVHKLQAVPFDERILRREQVGSESETVPLDRDAERRQRCREVVDRGIFPVVAALRCHNRIDVGGIALPPVVIGRGGTELLVHGRMVTGQDNRRVLIPRLLLAPLHKIRDLVVGAPDNVRILLVIFIPAQLADIPVRIVCIHRQHGEVKRLFLGTQLSQAFLREREQFFILKAPPDLIVRREFPVGRVVLPVVEIISAMLREAQTPSAEGGVGAKAHLHVVALLLQDISQARQVREEGGLRIHEVCSNALELKRYLQRQSACCRKHSSHGPGRVLERVASVQNGLVGTGEILIFLGDFRQARNIVYVKQAAARLVRIGYLH